MASGGAGRLAGLASALLIAAMLLGAAFLWVGVPIGWLWIGSQVESSSSLAAGIAVTMAGAIATIVVLAGALAYLNRRHQEIQARRGRPSDGASVLEAILVTSAGLAVVGFVVWFFGFAGASPVPLNIGF